MQILVKPLMGETVTLEVGSSDTVRGRHGERSGTKRPVERLRNGCCSRRTKECFSREGNLLAAVHGGRKRQEPSSMEAGSERKMERSYADQHRCVDCRTTARSKAKAAPEICQPGCMSRDVSLALFIVRSLELRGCIPRLEATCTAAITHTRYGV